MIYDFKEIQHLHLEISSRCNAACPLCPRTFWGYPLNQGYVEHDMTLEEAQKIFSPDFLRQLRSMTINGNFGDAVMNPHTTDICRYFKTENPDLKINISTNGGARDSKFWQTLAELDIEVFFCLDGLEDTHSIYRRNTLFTTVIKNAKTFIDAGGRAGWKMIKFEHNQHQIEQCRTMSQEMGFAIFLLVNDGRDNGPIFDKNKELVFMMGPSKWGDSRPNFDHMYQDRVGANEVSKQRLRDRISTIPIKSVTCEVSLSKSMYVSSTGDVYPCCYTGLFPGDYKSNDETGYGLDQIATMMYRNNALEHSLEECVKWFDEIEKSWEIDSFEQGRSVICNQSCGGQLKLDSYHVKEAQLTNNLEK